jgi:hypothetical protein
MRTWGTESVRGSRIPPPWEEGRGAGIPAAWYCVGNLNVVIGLELCSGAVGGMVWLPAWGTLSQSETGRHRMEPCLGALFPVFPKPPSPNQHTVYALSICESSISAVFIQLILSAADCLKPPPTAASLGFEVCTAQSADHLPSSNRNRPRSYSYLQVATLTKIRIGGAVSCLPRRTLTSGFFFHLSPCNCEL